MKPSGVRLISENDQAVQRREDKWHPIVKLDAPQKTCVFSANIDETTWHVERAAMRGASADSAVARSQGMETTACSPVQAWHESRIRCIGAALQVSTCQLVFG